MRKAIGNSRLGASLEIGTIHRLQEEVSKVQVLEKSWIDALLRKYDLQLVTSAKSQQCTRFGTYADPIDPWRRWLSAVRLDCDGETFLMEGAYENLVQLEERLPSCANDEWVCATIVLRPVFANRCCKLLSAIKPTST